MHGSDRVPDLKTITSEPVVGTGNIFNESEMALFFECMGKYAQKLLDTADIVREAIFLHSATLFRYLLRIPNKLCGLINDCFVLC